MSYNGYMWDRRSMLKVFWPWSRTSNIHHRTSTIEPACDIAVDTSALDVRGWIFDVSVPASSVACTNASVLVGLLWCVAILSIVVVGVLHRARIDLQIAKNYGDRIQAHYLALA